MNKTVKILSILLIAVMLLSVTSVVFGTTGEIEPSTIKAKYENQNTSDLTNSAGKILGWIRNIAAVAAVIIIAVLGIKFMIGSTEEKAEYKKSFIPLIVGIIVVLSASSLASWIFSIV